MTEFPNPNPDIWKTLAPAFIITALMEGLFIPLAYGAVTDPSAWGGDGGLAFALALMVGWGSFTVAIWVLGYRSYRRATPDAISVESDRVIGIFGHRLFGPGAGTRLAIPFVDVSALWEARDGYKGSHSPPPRSAPTRLG
jgi:hypothetical protein